MASFVSTGWPAAAAVTVKARDALGNPTGANVGAGGTADSSGTVTLPGLADATNYVATNGTRAVNFRTPNASTAAGAPADLSITPRLASDLLRTGGWLPPGAIAETIRNRYATSNFQLLTGQPFISGGIVLPGGRAVSSITFYCDSVTPSALTNQVFFLADTSRNILATTLDDTTTAWATGQPKTLQIASTLGGGSAGTYTPANAIEVYVGVCVAGTTVPNIKASSAAAAAIVGVAPLLGGTIGASGGFTTPASLVAGSPLAAATAQSRILYAYVS